MTPRFTLRIAKACLAAMVLAPLPASAADMPGVAHAGKTRQDWILQCQGCHRADASGTAETTPAMKGMLAQFLWVDGGREYLIRVPGMATAPISDAALASLANWTLWTFDAEHMPADFKPYTALEVGALRKQVLRVGTEKKRAELVSLIDAENARRSSGED